MEKKQDFIQNLSYDSVIFGFNGTQLKILILEYHNTGLFALPGGFVRMDEDLEDAVKNGIRQRTGIQDIYLEQFYTFGSLERSDPAAMDKILTQNDLDREKYSWMMGRFVSIGYYAPINYEEVEPKPDELSDSINWYPIDELPSLMMDHGEMVKKALEVLRQNLERKLVGMNLLPVKFTMKQLQQVYEAVLGEKLRRTTFQRKMLSQDILVRHEKLFQGKAHKAPYLYSFK
ncbi:NUDIX hydrolase [Maribacter cobaltidurans]|uniref:NUDIX hydrolase n=1 Tax=Maribacter cobaltidurans TaxID=1178778 RepID=A0A223V2A9_9FLAO|nr:NUDIX domain-containing protein [Maribacter cobaltidurans]ASV29452.1 NUDIX hydrolase [Maribacter cobaltidurans]GGD68934.1 DNA mismatch repair protein MutT [Maribacter cobaltidurans]